MCTPSSIRIWDTRTHGFTTEYQPAPKTTFTSAIYSPDGLALITTSSSGHIQTLDPNTLAIRKKTKFCSLTPSQPRINTLVNRALRVQITPIHPSDIPQMVIVPCACKQIHVISCRSGEVVHLEGHLGSVQMIALDEEVCFIAEYYL